MEIWYRLPYNSTRIEDAVAVEVVETDLKGKYNSQIRLPGTSPGRYEFWENTRGYMENYFPSMKDVYLDVAQRIKYNADRELLDTHKAIENSLQKISKWQAQLPELALKRQEDYRDAEYIEALANNMTERELAYGVKSSVKK